MYKVFYMPVNAPSGPMHVMTFATFKSAAEFALKQPKVLEIKYYDNQADYVQD
jgi:hypothetical protein